MVGKRSLHSSEIRSYIKVRHQLGIEPKTIYNEICQVYGDSEVSYRLVRNWIAKFKSGVESIKGAVRFGRKPTAVTPKNIKNVSEILETDARHTSRDKTKIVGISEGSVRTILK
jgi:transposase